MAFKQILITKFAVKGNVKPGLSNLDMASTSIRELIDVGNQIVSSSAMKVKRTKRGLYTMQSPTDHFAVGKFAAE